MFTLNLKVLLKKTNRTLRFTTLIWIATGLTGTLALTTTGVIELPFYQLLILSLIFSTPSFIILSPALWLPPPFSVEILRFLYFIFIAMVSCISVIAFFVFITKGFPFDRHTIFSILKPYVTSAMVIVPLALHSFTQQTQENKNQ